MSTNDNGTHISVETADRLEQLMDTPKAKRQTRQGRKPKSSTKPKQSPEQPEEETRSTGVGDGLGKVTDNLKTNIKRKIVTTAIRGAIDDIRRGDFGDLDNLTLEEIDNAIDCEFSCLEEMVDPKFALPPSSGSKLLLNGTSEKS